MAGRFLSLFKVFKRKKEKSPGAAPGKQPEEPKHIEPLQQDAAQDKTQEQEPGRGHFRKNLKMFRKFLRIRRKKTGITAAEGPAEPDSGLTELQAEPDVSPDSAEPSQGTGTSVTEIWVKPLLTSMTEDVAITYTDHGETKGITNTDTKPDSAERLEDSEAAMNKDRAKADMALTEDVANTGETQGIANTHTQPDLAECSEDSEAAMNSSDHRAKADMAVTEDRAITTANTGETQGITNTDTTPTPTLIQAPTKDFVEECAVLSQQQVPAIIRNIHQSLLSHVTLDARLQSDILRLAEEHPADVVLSLLRCAPTCDRAAAMIWRAIGSSQPAVEKVLPTLLCVMEDWPVHSSCTSDGDDRNVFALAATLVIWVIMPECNEAILLYSSRLFVALLFHVVITTQQLPPEQVDNFWRACREEHRLLGKPNRFAVHAMKALLCRLQCDHVVLAMECERGWDALLCAHTQHYAVGLLAREMRRNLIPLCSRIALHLLRQLNRQDPHWDLPFLAFLLEILEFLDLRECGGNVFKIMARYLHSKCRERRHLALRGLVVLSKDLLMARRICCLSPSLLELLSDADGEVVSMTLHVFTNVLQHKDILVSSTTGPKLAEALLLLFDHDNSHVQVLSIHLFCKVMELVVDEGKKALKTIVNESLYVLVIYCHAENCDVAKASRETLLGVAGFLKRRKLEELLKKQPPLNVNECLLAEDRSRAAEHLRRALRYLQSPQEPLREAAVRFMDAAQDKTQEQEPGRGRFRKNLKMFRKFLRIRRKKTGITAAEGPAEPDSGLTELQAEPDVSPDSAEPSQDTGTSAAMNSSDHRAKADMAVTEDRAITTANTGETQGITNTDTTPTPTLIQAPTKDFVEECAVRSQQQVPAIIRNIHQSLLSHVTLDARLQSDILRLAEEHPADVVLSLLRCAPTCDRAAAMIWRAIGSSQPAVEKVLPTLLCVMEDWPVHSSCTSDGDDRNVFALAATLVIWVIMPECNEAILLYSSRLFVALLFHAVITTQQLPPEQVDNFWRACREEHRLLGKPNRFAVHAMKALLCRLQCDHVVLAMECERGWDALLCAHTQHYAVGLLAREMRRNLIPLCSRIALHLLRQLNRQDPHWDLPFLAFLLEMLECLDLSEGADSTLETLSRHLRKECQEHRRLALRRLVVLSKVPSMARRICSLFQSLLELLSDADGVVVGMTLRIFTNVLQHKDILVSSTTAPKLAEALLLLFDHDNSNVQLLSLDLFFKVMELVVDEGKKPLKSIVDQSLPPLFFHCHDENQHVARASRETLHCAAGFLKRRELEQLVEREKLLMFSEVMLAEDRSRAAEHLRRALPYLQSPQEPLREAAVRFMGMAGQHLRGQPGELQVICEALQALRRDDSPSQTNIVVQEIFSERAAELAQKNQCLFKTFNAMEN
ncbi:unnamed protein product, partial [Coccothraustes coccothraustes]